MATIASGYFDVSEGGFVVRRPRVTDAIGGALMRSYAHAAALPDDMRRLLDQLDRKTRRH
ncbi:hypothetical protein [Sphingomonas lenta]|uniref:Uncharacterized protein n=1 Tax=Sphingomonas lenta TaxID=1141887 RepID=A0A2A2SHK9_9SPHN|nr:hypothetical protein [Sphingomonas lenta]PAX08692.1 hypothetical protein CKY28_04805 [Sphingomonas lenta]